MESVMNQIKKFLFSKSTLNDNTEPWDLESLRYQDLTIGKKVLDKNTGEIRIVSNKQTKFFGEKATPIPVVVFDSIDVLSPWRISIIYEQNRFYSID